MPVTDSKLPDKPVAAYTLILFLQILSCLPNPIVQPPYDFMVIAA